MERPPRTPLTIGLINGMPGEARRQTELQFRAILAAASGDTVRLMAFLPDVDHAALLAAGLDGLIVTGMPPRAKKLVDEPFWPILTALADFALEHRLPSVWSCFAAHVAVLHLDGVERRRLPRKLSGLMDCVSAGATHPLARSLPVRWRLPHSRYNDLPEDELLARGYRILSRSAEAGVDIFTKEFGAGGNVPFLFCQGHPEYDGDTLLREYRRDIRQFLAGATEAYPETPDGMFDADIAAQLTAFRERAMEARAVDTFASFPWKACAAGLSHSWRDLTIGLYSNWLSQTADHRPHRDCPRPPDAATTVAHP